MNKKLHFEITYFWYFFTNFDQNDHSDGYWDKQTSKKCSRKKLMIIKEPILRKGFDNAAITLSFFTLF